MYTRKKINRPWEGYIEPFEIVKSVYFVGTFQTSCHMIDTGDGLVLIDTGNADTATMIVDSIFRLGFDPRDIKYILSTHWHNDHTACQKFFHHFYGAKTTIGRPDVDYVQGGYIFNPDLIVDDGDKIALGDKVFEFVHTPGHTKGTMSIFFEVKDGDKTYRVGMFGGAGANTLTKSAASYYEGATDDYLASIDKLLARPVDVFIGNHTWNNDTERKGKRLREEGVNEFIDPNEWTKFLTFCRQRCLDTIEKDKEKFGK